MSWLWVLGGHSFKRIACGKRGGEVHSTPLPLSVCGEDALVSVHAGSLSCSFILFYGWLCTAGLVLVLLFSAHLEHSECTIFNILGETRQRTRRSRGKQDRPKPSGQNSSICQWYVQFKMAEVALMGGDNMRVRSGRHDPRPALALRGMCHGQFQVSAHFYPSPLPILSPFLIFIDLAASSAHHLSKTAGQLVISKTAVRHRPHVAVEALMGVTSVPIPAFCCALWCARRILPGVTISDAHTVTFSITDCRQRDLVSLSNPIHIPLHRHSVSPPHCL